MSASAPSRLAGSERRTIRFSAAIDGGKPVEFYGLDRARLHAWALALGGKSVHISKQVYDTLQLPPTPLGSAVIETWDERSTFLILNADLKGL